MGGVAHLCFDLGGWSSRHLRSSGAWFGVVGGQVDIHIRVCMNLLQERVRMFVAPPTVRSF